MLTIPKWKPATFKQALSELLRSLHLTSFSHPTDPTIWILIWHMMIDEARYIYPSFPPQYKGAMLDFCSFLSYWTCTIGRILILGSRVTSQCCSAHAHIWRCCLLSSPGFLTSPYMERAPGHVTTAQSRDLASPIYGHVGALTGYTWPRDLISLGPDTGVCNGCNVCPITHA